MLLLLLMIVHHRERVLIFLNRGTILALFFLTRNDALTSTKGETYVSSANEDVNSTRFFLFLPPHAGRCLAIN